MQCSHRKVPSMSGITVVAVTRLTNVTVEGNCWFRCRFGCRLWCWFRCRLGWCWFWRRAWAWLHRGVVDLKLVAPVPAAQADGLLQKNISINCKNLLFSTLLCNVSLLYGQLTTFFQSWSTQTTPPNGGSGSSGVS